MSTVDLKKLKALREETGVSFSLCKKALDESNNDIEAAKKKLQEWGVEKAAGKADRATGAGGIFSYIHHNRKVGAMVELQSETDFVSGNEEFKTLGNEIAMQAASVPAASTEELLKSEYIRDPRQSIADLIQAAVLKFGENIKLARASKWMLGEQK